MKTHQQAKDFAKKLKVTLQQSGIHYPLNACQSAVAKAIGASDWWTLTRAERWPTLPEKEVFELRLLAALPFACRPPVIAWLAGEVPPEAPPGFLPRWYVDAVPYFLATMALHRRTPILRPGSGRGQRLRAEIVDHLLLRWAQVGLDTPLFDPVTFQFVYRGRPSRVFEAFLDRDGFDQELDRLVTAGVIKLGEDSVRLGTPGIDLVKARAIWDRATKAKEWLDNDAASAAEPIYEALSLIGVRRAREIAEALLAYGDRRYVVASGSLREVLSQIANDGDLETFVHALNVFAFILPASARELRDAVPAKILNEFVARNRAVPITKAFRWMGSHPDWADRLRSSANDPAEFTRAVDKMVEGMRAA